MLLPACDALAMVAQHHHFPAAFCAFTTAAACCGPVILITTACYATPLYRLYYLPTPPHQPARRAVTFCTDAGDGCDIHCAGRATACVAATVCGRFRVRWFVTFPSFWILWVPRCGQGDILPLPGCAWQNNGGRRRWRKMDGNSACLLPQTRHSYADAMPRKTTSTTNVGRVDDK